MTDSRARVRRRRRRRPRIGGIIIRSLAFLLVVFGCVFGLSWLGRPHSSQSAAYAPASAPGLTVLAGLPQVQVQGRNRRLVYPYSVVPGGVHSAAELQDATAHDPAVATHYAGFDFKRARLVEVQQPELVYLSYRKGNRIYWTRKQASLHKGEKLLTDGKITARTRCGNQVSVLPRAETAPDEPTMAELDRPDGVASGIDQLIPSNFNSSLLNVNPPLPPVPPGGPTGSTGGSTPPPLGGGGGGGTVGPPIGGGGGGNCPNSKSTNCNHNPPPPPPPPPPTVPEPATIVLMLSGAGALLARYRFAKR